MVTTVCSVEADSLHHAPEIQTRALWRQTSNNQQYVGPTVISRNAGLNSAAQQSCLMPPEMLCHLQYTHPRLANVVGV